MRKLIVALLLLAVLAGGALAVERLPMVQTVIVPGQTGVIICDGELALIEIIDDLTITVACLR